MKNKKINTQLQALGTTLGLKQQDIIHAKKTMISMLSVTIVATIFIIIGKIAFTQLDPSGLYYTGVSISDFGLFSRFF